MLVYLAGPIDLVPPEFQNWKREVKEKLKEYGITTVDPSGTFVYAQSPNWYDAKETARKLISINEHNLIICDMVIILFSKNAPSVGTPIELYLTHKHNIPHVVIYNDNKNLPAYLIGLSNEIVYNINDAIKYVVQYRDNIL